MTDYAKLVAILLLVLSPLFVPLATTLVHAIHQWYTRIRPVQHTGRRPLTAMDKRDRLASRNAALAFQHEQQEPKVDSDSIRREGIEQRAKSRRVADPIAMRPASSEVMTATAGPTSLPTTARR
jgi:hypothetical protein